MKSLILGFFILAMSAAHAQMIQEVVANDVSGGMYNKKGEIETAATECKYSMGNDYSYKDQIVVYINSDRNAYVNFSIRIPKNLMPLKEGTRFESITGATVSYSRGILKSVEIENDFPISSDKDTLEIKIDPNLMHPESAKGLSIMRDLLLVRRLKFSEIDCQF